VKFRKIAGSAMIAPGFFERRSPISWIICPFFDGKQASDCTMLIFAKPHPEKNTLSASDLLIVRLFDSCATTSLALSFLSDRQLVVCQSPKSRRNLATMRRGTLKQNFHRRKVHFGAQNGD